MEIKTHLTVKIFQDKKPNKPIEDSKAQQGQMRKLK